LLEELGIPYELKLYKRDPKTKLAPVALTAIHPLGKSPVITDGKLTVAESGAILEYLAEKYGQGTRGDLTHLEPAKGSAEQRRCPSLCDQLNARPAFQRAIEKGGPVLL
jgi:glutathione S-transferase